MVKLTSGQMQLVENKGLELNIERWVERVAYGQATGNSQGRWRRCPAG
jgi:hypothetical protein